MYHIKTAKPDLLVTAGRAELRFSSSQLTPSSSSSQTFQRPTSAAGAGWSPRSLRHGRARRASCRPRPPLGHTPLTAARGAREALPRTEPALHRPAPQGALGAAPEPRTEPARRCRVPLPLRPGPPPSKTAPFPERDTRAEPPGPVQPSPAAPGSPRRERGSVPQRRHRRTGPRCPSGAAPQLSSGRLGSLRSTPQAGNPSRPSAVSLE
ncbi:basic proline-rich protein-like [Zonotrichia leucophrys gambelii]|uniref:basic proline-rich protein-like n=1 Tax=Zonotrichia leucophrys gambelii TaxID=257770 RepID=UPI00314019CF